MAERTFSDYPTLWALRGSPLPMEQHNPPQELPPGPPPAHQLTAGAKHSGHGWIWFLLIIVLIAAGFWYWRRREAEAAASKKPSQPPATPVVVVKATKGDIGVYFTGLGAVTPINTVSIKTRVDGQLMQVLYKEGDLVQQGGLLAELDSRPFE